MDKREYYEWLTEMVGGDTDYEQLFHVLFEKEFYYIVDFDGDRAADGISLRSTYCRFIGRQVDLGLGACTILEMLVALAIACEDNIMHDRDFGDRTPEWFWMILKNLGLDKFNDSNFNETEVYYRLDIFLERKYEKDGNGGAFPLKKCDKNQRLVPIWIQLNEFIQENYPI